MLKPGGRSQSEIELRMDTAKRKNTTARVLPLQEARRNSLWWAIPSTQRFFREVWIFRPDSRNGEKGHLGLEAVRWARSAGLAHKERAEVPSSMSRTGDKG